LTALSFIFLRKRPTNMSRWSAVAICFGACILVGCANSEGPKRFRISGEATFDGQPIVHGDVLFTPDGSKGNSGPQGIAQIRNGKYDTAAADGKGIAGGPTVVRVTGLTGPGGKLVCEYEMKLDLPRADSTQNIDVPKKGAARSSNKPEI
jgi:hypothetical protein